VKRFLVGASAIVGALCSVTATAAAAPASPRPAHQARSTADSLASGPGGAAAHPRSGGLWFCRPWGSGPNPDEVCINAQPNGYDAKFINGKNPTVLVDFHLLSSAGVYLPDQGAFWSSPGSIHTFFFTTRNLGCARVYVDDQRSPFWEEYSQSDSPAGNCGF
jgi:hypothetical protein